MTVSGSLIRQICVFKNRTAGAMRRRFFITPRCCKGGEKLKSQDRSLWEKIRDYVKDLAAKIKKVYEGIRPDSEEGRYVAEMKDAIEELQNLFAEGLSEAGSNYQAAMERGGKDYDGPNSNDFGSIMFSERDEARFKEYEQIIDDIVEKAILNKGDIGEKYNQTRISPVTPITVEMVGAASGGEVDLTKKYIAISGGDVWHEYQRHTDPITERDRGQIAFTQQQFVEAIKCIYQPDVVECIFRNQNNPTQRQSFAYAKQTDEGHYVVVEAVGGRTNPNIVPVEILYVRKQKWEQWIGSGKTIGEMLFDKDPKKLQALDTEFNKKNRVTAAQFASDEAIASTPHSPRSDIMISQEDNGVNLKLSERTGEGVSSRAMLADAFEDLARTDLERKKIQEYREKAAQYDAEEQKLRELRGQIKELSFAKGPRDRKRLQPVLLTADHIDPPLEGIGIDGAHGIGGQGSVGRNKVGRGQRGYSVGHGCFIVHIVKNREGKAGFRNKILGDLQCFPGSVGHVDHQKLDLIPYLAKLFIKVRHFTPAGSAPAGPEIQHDGLAEIIRKLHRIAFPVHHGKIRRDHCLGLCSLRCRSSPLRFHRRSLGRKLVHPIILTQFVVQRRRSENQRRQKNRNGDPSNILLHF